MCEFCSIVLSVSYSDGLKQQFLTEKTRLWYFIWPLVFSGVVLKIMIHHWIDVRRKKVQTQRISKIFLHLNLFRIGKMLRKKHEQIDKFSTFQKWNLALIIFYHYCQPVGRRYLQLFGRLQGFIVHYLGPVNFLK